MEEDATLDGSESYGAFLAGRAVHDGLELAFDAFDRAYRRATGPDGGPLPIHAPDFYLATCCESGLDAAWSELTGTYRRRLAGLLRRQGVESSVIDAVLDDLPGSLVEPPADGSTSTRLGTYRGRSQLFSWLAVIAIRRVADHHRRAAAAPAEAAGLSQIRARTRSPSRVQLDDETAGRLSAALGEVWEVLTPRERLALLLRYRDGLPQTRIATLLGIGPPRVSRLLSAARGKLRDAVREELGAGPDAADSVLWDRLRDAVQEWMATSRAPRD